MVRPLRYLLLALVVTAALVGGGLALAGGGDDDGATPPSAPASSPFRTTPLSGFDGATVTVRRAAFCDRIDPRQVTAALGGQATAQRSWNDGDRAVLAPGVKDVAHEFGCEYTGAGGVAVRAWVFAPPVGAAQATVLAAQTGKGACTTSPATYGASSTLLACPSRAGQSVTYRGLFGDAWLSCQLSTPDRSTPADRLTDRAGRWCVGVAEAAEAP